MKLNLADLRHRHLGTISIVCGIGILCLLAYSWWQNWVELGDRIAAADERIARVQWTVDHEEELKERLKTALRSKDLNSTIIGESDPTVATATLQKFIEQAAQETGSKIISAQPLPSQKEDDLAVISARYQLAVTPESLTQIVYRLETYRPYIFIDKAVISTQPNGAAPQQEAEGGAHQLALQLDLHAFATAADHG